MSPAILPPPTPATPFMTGAEFLAQYGDKSGFELVKGHLVSLPMPGGMHGEICGNVYSILREFVRPRGLGRLMTNDTYVRTAQDPDSFRGADVCFLSYGRLPKDQETPKGPIPAPDLVFEVKSPTDRVNRLSAKASEYLEAGVTAVVLLIPETRIAAVFRDDDVPLRLVGNDVLELPDVLPGFSVPVSAFFE